MSPEEAVASLIDKSKATLIGRAFDVSQNQSRKEAIVYMSSWWHAINREMENG